MKVREIVELLEADGFTREECQREMREALAFHIEGLREDGDPVPLPSSTSSYVELG